MIDREWLDSLKIGDAVVVKRGIGKRIANVQKTTKTQIHVGYTKFRRSDGHQTGNSRWGEWLCQVTDEDREGARCAALLKRIQKTTKGTLTTDQLERIVAILDEGKAPE